LNPEGAQLLAQLRDIHGAAPAPWWPPAPGWWLLFVLLASALAYGLLKGWRAWRVWQRRRRMERWVDAVLASTDPQQAPQAFLAAINRVFKAVALAAFPGEHCAALQGPAWTGFLRERLAGEPGEDQLEVLADGPYRTRAEFDSETLERLARQWIRRHG